MTYRTILLIASCSCEGQALSVPRHFLGTLCFLYWFAQIPTSFGAEVDIFEYKSAYFLGRGHTGIAIADDIDSIFYNPAGLAQGKGVFKKIVLASPGVEISKDTRDVAKQISLQDADPTDTFRKREGRPQHVGGSTFSGVLLRKAAIGGFASTSNTALLMKDPNAGGFESLQASSTTTAGLTFTLAQSFFSPEFLFGATAKYLYRAQAAAYVKATDINNLKEATQDEFSMVGTGMGADIGFMMMGSGREPVNIGGVIKDVGGVRFTPKQETSLPRDERPLKDRKQTVNIGVAFAPGTRASKFRLLLDVNDALGAYYQTPYQKLNFGVELSVADVVGFTMGVSRGYLSGGGYIDLRFLRIDLGQYTEELGEIAGERPDPRFFIRIMVAL